MEIKDFLPYFAIALSTISLIISFSSFRRKSGLLITGYYVLSSDMDSPQRYVSIIALQNNKDKAVIIFEIILRVGFNYYIKLEDFDNTPLIIKPYEVYSKEYGPIEFYGTGTHKINIDKLLENRKIPKQIILSTSEGKYKVGKSIKRWHSIAESLRNYSIAIINPIRLRDDETWLGGNILYAMEIINTDGKKEVYPIHPDDYQLKSFRIFQLTKESLMSRDSLQMFINNLVKRKIIKCKSVNIVDLEKVRKDMRTGWTGDEIEAKYHNWFVINIIARIYSKYEYYKTRIQNAKRMKKKRSG